MARLKQGEILVPRRYVGGEDIAVRFNKMEGSTTLKDYAGMAADQGGYVMPSGMFRRLCYFPFAGAQDPLEYRMLSNLAGRLTESPPVATATVVRIFSERGERQYLLADELGEGDFNPDGTVKEDRFRPLLNMVDGEEKRYGLKTGMIASVDKNTGLASIIKIGDNLVGINESDGRLEEVAVRVGEHFEIDDFHYAWQVVEGEGKGAEGDYTVVRGSMRPHPPKSWKDCVAIREEPLHGTGAVFFRRIPSD